MKSSSTKSLGYSSRVGLNVSLPIKETRYIILIYYIESLNVCSINFFSYLMNVWLEINIFINNFYNLSKKSINKKFHVF